MKWLNYDDLSKLQKEASLDLRFWSNYEKKIYDVLTPSGLKLLFKAKVAVGEKMFNELKNRKVAFELLAIAKQLGARDNYVSIFELKKYGFKRSTLTENIKLLQNLGYLFWDKKGKIKFTTKPWVLTNENFMKINSLRLWKIFLDFGSAMLIWNVSQLLKIKNKKNHKVVKTYKFVNKYVTKKVMNSYTTLKLLKLEVSSFPSELSLKKCILLTNTFLKKILKGSRGIFSKTSNYLKNYMNFEFLYNKIYENNSFVITKYLILN
ncbi:Hypothetical protein MAU_2960 [Metamycoplasma auris 15026]|uniref:Uncharacterized protein n=1 Tax=Metamycoplasma auris 15026 TaxID=1188233 RepID=N9VBM5_9BACT|nr:hypothetical protein [Metamycoplasma auris]ENY68811.1 Hypothetical protein MAU_2960 [Metamycoplasma auris 15026]